MEQIIQYLELQIQHCERQIIQYNLEAGAYKNVLDYIEKMEQEGGE